MRITDFLTASADVAGRIEKKDWGAVDGATLFSEISTLRPNEYPFMIAPEDINGRDGVTTDESSLIFGTSVRKTNNLYMDMAYGGNTSERYVNSQTNLGLKFDLKSLTEGLTANAYMTFVIIVTCVNSYVMLILLILSNATLMTKGRKCFDSRSVRS